nr:tail fiber domain-containing protein [Candidatus Saccharibacteria bacterium]
YSNTSGYNNTAIGSYSLYSNTTARVNTAIGHYSLYSNSTGEADTAIGTYSLTNNRASDNTAVGDSSLYTNYSGSDNVALGRNSLYYNYGGWANTSIGRNSLLNNTSGNYNTALGYNAGDNITTGSYNIMLGYNVDAPTATSSYRLNIGDLIYGDLNAGGNLGIGSGEDAVDKLRVWGDVKLGNNGTNGCVKRYDGAALTGTCASDERFKEDITNMDGVLNKVANLQAVTYKFNQFGKDYTGATGNEIQYGLIAQQVLQVAPELVSTDENGYLKLRYDLLPIYAIAAIGEQQSQINNAQARLTTLENSLQPATNNILDLTNGGTIQGNLNVVGNLNVTGPVTMKSLTVTDNVVIAGNLTVQNITVANITVNGHIITAGNAPVATAGTAAGTEDTINNIPAPQVTIEGNDTAGTITIVAGANTGTGALAEVNFDKPFGGNPRAVLSAKNADTALLQIFNQTQNNKLILNTLGTPVPGQTYVFDYFIVQ